MNQLNGYKTIFEAAIKYDFEAVKSFVTNGSNISECDKCGISVLATFIDGYYRYILDDEIDSDELLPAELRKELGDRTEPIKHQIDWFLSNGADINAGNMIYHDKEGETETALMYAVGYTDYCMIQYLLECGANPKKWLFDIPSRNERKEYEDWLIEDFHGLCIDIDKESRRIEIGCVKYKY